MEYYFVAAHETGLLTVRETRTLDLPHDFAADAWRIRTLRNFSCESYLAASTRTKWGFYVVSEDETRNGKGCGFPSPLAVQRRMFFPSRILEGPETISSWTGLNPFVHVGLFQNIINRL